MKTNFKLMVMAASAVLALTACSKKETTDTSLGATNSVFVKTNIAVPMPATPPTNGMEVTNVLSAMPTNPAAAAGSNQ